MIDLIRAVPPSRIAAWLLAVAGLFLILNLELLAAVLAGLLVFHVTHSLSPLIEGKLSSQLARMLAVSLVAAIVIGLLTLAIVALVGFFRSDAGSAQGLLDRLMTIVDDSRGQLPDWLVAYIPEDSTEMRRALTAWLQAHRAELSLVGAETVQTIVRLLIGMVLGAMI